ncbi:MAG: ribosomal protein S18-alanine N-acetyltransferase [Alphaproteobacteria bacterium]|nr:ribosomal protein S18-alanine N-acetyltransferase [Alphaproteobacteria bacterium]
MIRAAHIHDIDQLEEIENTSFTSDLISRRQFRHFLTIGHASLFVWDDGGHIAGYILTAFHSQRTAARIYSIAVRQNDRGRGIGAALLKAAENDVRDKGLAAITLEVRANDENTIRLYKRAGYTPTGQKQAYYEDGEDALRMRKDL